jgi:undecaprenyl diphosphate synthase
MKHQSSTLAVPETSAVPRHVAIIMDGNGRWATKRFLPRVAGHAKGVDAVRSIVEASAERGIEFLTLFAFSSENWRRPADEVSVLMRLFMTVLEREVGKMANNGIRLRIVGDMSRFDPKLQEMAAKAEAQTPATAADPDRLRQLRRPLGCHAGRLPDGQGQAGRDRLHRRRAGPYLAMAYAPSRTCSSAPAASSASPISCCGSWPTASCISPRPSGLISTPRRWTRPSAPTNNASAASGAPAPRCWTRKRLPDAQDACHHGVDPAGNPAAHPVFRLFPAFAMAVLVFFAAGAWECFRLFKSPRPRGRWFGRWCSV